MTIETERLIIRQRTPDDLTAIHTAKMAVKNDLMRWMTWASEDQFTVDATAAFIATQHTPGGEWDGLPGFDRENGELAVMCGLREKTPGVYEAGYWVTRPFLGRGYATEACRAMMSHAFNVLNANAMVICHFEENENSWRVIEKCGFIFDRVEKDGAFCHALQKRVDMWHYALAR
jgi:RimJ/RimL family protein N-acetyltransferase